MSWTKIKGHSAGISVLRSALAGERLPHAYIFTGDDGVGKTLVATETGTAYLCTENSDQACGQCKSCVWIHAGNHPDFYQLQIKKDKSHITVDVIRDALQWLSLKSVTPNGRRIMIVPDADRMTVEAANAFLKALEEPPEGTLIVLTTAHYESLLPTVISRCQKITFSGLSESEMSEILSEWNVFDDKDIRLLSRISGGSPGGVRRILNAAWSDESASGWKECHALVVEILDRPGEMDPLEAADRLNTICDLRKKDTNEGSESENKNPASPRNTLRIVMEMLIMEVSQRMKQKSDQRIKLAALHTLAVKFLENLEKNVNIMIGTDVFFIRLCNILNSEESTALAAMG